MMDAVMYFKEQERMCANYNYCNGCPLAEKMEGDGFNCCTAWQRLYPAEAVRIVEEWSKTHPKQTNADKFKEVFGKEPIVILRDVANDYGEWLYAPYEAPKGAE